MAACIALLRGINVGRAKRIAMADLRTLIEEMGYTKVRTLLNSGNAVFQADRPNVNTIASDIEAAIQRRFGFSAAVVVLTATSLNTIIRENPLLSVVTEPARHLVAFVSEASVLDKMEPILARHWESEVVARGTQAAYLWCPDGIIESRLAQAFARLAGEAATTRNWSTVLKLQSLADGDQSFT
jgi:uncharacterized protein (DUF1697 family)